MRRSLLPVSLVLALGCGQTPAKKDPPNEKPAPAPAPAAPASVPVPSSVAAASTPASNPAPASAPAEVGQAFEGLPGWLAVGAEPGTSNKYPWSPALDGAQLAIFSVADDPFWSKAKPGSSWVAVSPSGAAPVTLARVGNEPYGCDKTPTPMVSFTATGAVPPGAVWILPEGQTASSLAVEASEAKALPAGVTVAKDARVFKIGDAFLVYEVTGKKTATLKVFVGGAEKFSQEYVKEVPAGAEDGPISVAGSDNYDVDLPLGAFQFKNPDAVAVVLESRGYEGNGFPVLRLAGGEVKLLEGPGAYYCAF